MVCLVGSKTGRIENRAEKSEEKTDFMVFGWREWEDKKLVESRRFLL